MKYHKLIVKLNAKGYDLRAKELGSFCYPVGRWSMYLGKGVYADTKKEWPIEAYSFKTGRSLHFNTLRQVQRWADNGFKDADLPDVEYTNGHVTKQTSRWPK